LWRRAIASRRVLAARFQGGDLIEKLVERDGNHLKLDPVGAMNLVFGQSNIGFVSKGGMLRGLQRMRTMLGPESQAWNSLREEAFMRLARSGDGAMQPTGRDFSGGNFAKAWETMTQKSPEVVRVLFTQEERNLINQFARVANRITTPVRGGANFSNSGSSIIQAIARVFNSPRIASFLNSIPIAGGVSNIGQDIRATATIRGGFPTGPQPSPPSEAVTRAIPALAGTAGQAVNQR
jgi:hypothetical protein